MQAPAQSCGDTAEALNSACFCITLDQSALGRALGTAADELDLGAMLHARCPYVFSAQPVFIASAWLRRVEELVAAIESVVQSAAWHEEVLAVAPAIARHEPQGAAGVFYGYDFHLNATELGLVEINTNAGGAMLNTLLARAQRGCCAGVQALSPDNRGADGFEAAIVRMFQQEWAAAGHERTLRRIVMVDIDPTNQYLYPEFLLFQRLFRAAGIECIIADPGELQFDGSSLTLGGQPIDLVYNRLTDFYLADPVCAALRDAYLADAVVLTPNPRGYALYADKRRLIQLTDMALLERLGVDEQTRTLLADHVPHTVEVQSANAEALWARRRQLFFKPVSGYGSRGAYRGDKLTRRVWEEIVRGAYIAQALVTPGDRQLRAGSMKFDLRAYAYRGTVQWTAARMYQGQTTNFRTEGGGFAPVYSLGSEDWQTSTSRHASYIFLLDQDGDVLPLPHALYQALIQAEKAPPALWGKRYRLADWYVALEGDRPVRMVREWYGWVRFDEDGHFDPTDKGPSAPARTRNNIDPSALPSEPERQRIEELLFAQ